MSKHRTVDVYRSVIENEKTENSVIASGIFHCFSNETDNREIYTVALVELPDGSVITPWVRTIKFTSQIECDVDAKAKTIATEFYRYWHNAPGTNTDQGFDDWWSKNKGKILSNTKL